MSHGYKAIDELHRFSFSALLNDVQEYEGPTHIELRQSCSSLDCYLKFSTAPTSALGLVVFFIFEDSFQIQFSEEKSERLVSLNYPL